VECAGLVVGQVALIVKIIESVIKLRTLRAVKGSEISSILKRHNKYE